MKTPSTTARSSEIPSSVDDRTDEQKETDRIAAEQARDAAGADLVQAEGEGAITTAAGLVLTPTNVPTLEGDEKAWSDVLIVANAPDRMPTKGERKVIVAQARTQPDEDGTGAGKFLETAYPKSGDAYVGHADVDAADEPARVFPDITAPIFLIGQNVKQFGLGGVSRQEGYLSVGPGSSIVAAVNLALQKGAKTVEVHGMTDHDKAIVGPWLDRIAGEFESLTY